MNLRPYQSKAIHQIRLLFAKGTKKVLLHLSTGGGKTVIFCEILNGVRKRGKKAIIVVYGKGLVDNASQRLMREGIPHGVLQGNHWNYRPNEPIQVCSITTLFKRKIVPEADLVVIDEAHMSTGVSYEWLLSQYQDKFILPVTATPHLKKGMRHVADEVVYPIAFKELVKQDFLVAPKYFCPIQLDLSKVKIDSKTGDYSLADLALNMDGPKIYGEVVSHYKEICNGVPAICFAINIQHSNMLVNLFNINGIKAEHVDAKTPQSVRAEIIKRLENGETKVIVNVGVMTTGIDIPCLKAIIFCRPTKSYNLMIQMAGRGTRPYKDKDFFYILDHANNVLEHGFIENEQECNLDGWEKDSVRKAKVCKECFFAWMPEKPREPCPECGFIEPAKETAGKEINLEVADAKLVEIKSAEDLVRIKIKKFVDKEIEKALKRNYKPGYVFYRIKEEFDENEAKKYSKYIDAKFKLHSDSRQTNVGSDNSYFRNQNSPGMA